MNDDLHTIDLFKILDDRTLLGHLHALQVERCEENALTGGKRPSGMRLSCADPVRRVKAALDPWWATTIDDGVGARGHALEAFLEVALFRDEYGYHYTMDYASQVPIQWHPTSRSAFDFVISEGPRVVSCKSSVKSGAPSADNLAQERRMMALAGMPAGSCFEVWVVNPSTFRAVGPHTYRLEQEHIDAAREELDGVSRAYGYFSDLVDVAKPSDADGWNRPEFWESMFGLVSTSGAFRYEIVDASPAIEKRNRAFLRARHAAAEAKREADAAKELFRPFVEEQIALARAEGIAKPVVRAYSGDLDVTYSIDARGAMRVTERPREPADAPATV